VACNLASINDAKNFPDPEANAPAFQTPQSTPHRAGVGPHSLLEHVDITYTGFSMIGGKHLHFVKSIISKHLAHYFFSRSACSPQDNPFIHLHCFSAAKINNC
jgi:hypothetical protein